MSVLYYGWDGLPFFILVILIAFTLHEFAHAFTAYKFGDNTAYKEGRVTLNPMHHIDLFGMILILLAGFGWARPVPVNRSRFKYPRVMSIIVSAAGPISNLLIAFIGVFLLYGYFAIELNETASLGVAKAIELFLSILIHLNLLLFIFNLIPLPPLDGYRIIEDVAPLRMRLKMLQVQHWGIYLFLLIVFIPPLNRAFLQPILSLSGLIGDQMDALMQSWFDFRVFWQ
ncbi:site-2 protease family protein [Marinicrinis lubricantis]|uniref:Site-2 protease family protein n=1 Tax=Marinicrinis lubricantis TaxID=2086470 RepID=A0ABW1IV96_9BACL